MFNSLRPYDSLTPWNSIPSIYRGPSILTPYSTIYSRSLDQAVVRKGTESSGHVSKVGVDQSVIVPI